MASMNRGATWGSFQTLAQKLEREDSSGTPQNSSDMGRGQNTIFHTIGGPTVSSWTHEIGISSKGTSKGP